jgi:hypothetical protein
MAEYMIGTSHGDLGYIAAKFAADGLNAMPDPRSDPIEYSQPARLGDGTVRGLGWLQQTWHWDVMTEAQCATLRGYIGVVNVLTRNNAGTMAEYTAVLVWPEKEPEHWSNHVLDVTVTLIQMVVV